MLQGYCWERGGGAEGGFAHCGTYIGGCAEAGVKRASCKGHVVTTHTSVLTAKWEGAVV